MDKTICLQCKHHEKREAHGGWSYTACMKKPYNGAWVKNISCPKTKADNDNNGGN